MSNVKIKQAIYFSLIVGIPVTVILFIYPDVFLKLIYNTDEGINYVKILAPIFFLQYIQSPLSASLQAMGKAKTSMYGTFIGIFIKTSTLALFTSFRIGMWGLIISIILVLFLLHVMIYVI